MKSIYGLGLSLALAFAATSAAKADDDYQSGYAAGRNNYYDRPDNSSSADYYLGYQEGQRQREMNNYNYSNSNNNDE